MSNELQREYEMRRRNSYTKNSIIWKMKFVYVLSTTVDTTASHKKSTVLDELSPKGH